MAIVQKPVLHGRDHAPGGADPIPGSGIQFDLQPQHGGFLVIDTDSTDSGAPSGHGIVLTANQGDLALNADNDIEIDAVHDEKHFPGRDFLVSSDRDVTFDADHDLTLNADASGVLGGNIYLAALPTADPGVTGAIWNSGGRVVLSGFTGGDGEPGPPGPTGPAGPQGATGSQGPAGPTGPTGATGADSTVPGPTGPQGVKGDTGTTGAQGPQGNTGSTGPAGPGVAAGGTIGQVLTKTSATDYASNWQTPAVGGGFVSGAGAPTAGVGANGDIYLDTVTGRMYGPKAAGAWPATQLGHVIQPPASYADVAGRYSSYADLKGV